MATNSKIEWTNHTANLWWGCTKVHRGCDNCYAETLSHRWGNDIWGNNKPRKRIKSTFRDLNKYQAKAKELGQLHKVFVGSMMDIFEKPMPLLNPIPGFENTGQIRDKLFNMISEGAFPNLMFLLLSKRPSNINKYIPESWKSNHPENVMFGTSPVDQPTYDNLKPKLLQVNGKRFLSVEPQLDSIDLGDLSGIDWVIQGGESGHGKRPFKLDWASDMRAQCLVQNTAYFFKQIDKVQEIPEQYLVRQFPDFCGAVIA